MSTKTKRLSTEVIDSGVSATDGLKAVIAEYMTTVPDTALPWFQISGGYVSEAAYAEGRRRENERWNL
jgi:hypothetical protein